MNDDYEFLKFAGAEASRQWALETSPDELHRLVDFAHGVDASNEAFEACEEFWEGSFFDSSTDPKYAYRPLHTSGFSEGFCEGAMEQLDKG